MIVLEKAVLAGERVRFTPLQIENIYRHFEWNNDKELNRLDSELPYEEESFGEFKLRFERMLRADDGTTMDLEIHAEDGTLIGVAYLTNISEYHRRCTAGITIGDRNYWGKGYGRDALTVLLEYCFDTLNMHRVSTTTFEYNDAWRRLVKWAGFEFEGRVTDYLLRDGQYYYMELFGLVETAYRYRKMHQQAGL